MCGSMVRVERCREAACARVDDVRYVVSRCCTYVWYGKVWSLIMGRCVFEGLWFIGFLSFMLCVSIVYNWFGLCYRRVFTLLVLWV